MTTHSKRLALACGSIATVAIATSALAAVPGGRGIGIVRYPLIGEPEPVQSIPDLVATTLTAAKALHDVSGEADLAVMVGQEKVSRRRGLRREIFSVGLITVWCSTGPVLMYTGEDWIPAANLDEFLSAVERAMSSFRLRTEDEDLLTVALALRDSFLAQVAFDLNQETMRLN